MKLYWTGDVGYYDEKTGEGITSSMVKRQLDEAGGGPVEVDLMSRGGDFWQIAPIMGMIRSYPGKTTVRYAGLVGSAASAIAMAFDEAVSDDLSIFMIHNAQGFSMGDHRDMRNSADNFEKLTAMMAEEYAKKSGKSLKDIKTLMDGDGKVDGTWIMGAKIKEMGFSDRHESSESSKAQNSSMLLISAQAQFSAGVAMWAKSSTDSVPDTKDAELMAEVETLIAAGSFDKLAPVPSDAELSIKKYPIAKNGKVFRSSLRAISARAAKDDPKLAEWAVSMIAKIDAKGETRVNKEAVLAWLKDNPGCASEVAAVMGLNLVTQAVNAAVEMKAKLDAANVSDPIAVIAQMKKDLEAVETDRVSNALTAHFGPVKLEHNGMTNDLRAYAEVKLAGVKSADLPAKIEEFKKDSIALKLASDRMDVNSAQNVFGVVELRADQKNKPVATFDGVPVVTV